MCGRFVQVEKPEFYAEHFGAQFVRTETLKENFNVAPTQPIYAIADHAGERVLTSFRWGLVPFWAKDIRFGNKAINARSETVTAKPAFRDSFAKRRCIIPVDGFYEWERKAKGKLPHYIFGADRRPLPVAGLWSSWRDPETDDRVLTATILTGKPNAMMEGIHDRMPIILQPEAWDMWLDPETEDTASLTELLAPYPDGLLSEYPVSTLVNSVANNGPDLVVRLATPAVDSP